MEKDFIGKNWEFSGCAGRGYTQNNTVSSDKHLKTSDAVTWSVSACFKPNLQLQGWFVDISLRAISDVRQAVDISTAQDGAAYIKATVWSSCS